MKTLILTLALLSLAALSSAQATTLYDNLSASPSRAEGVSGSEWIANRFTTDANPYTLTNVTIRATGLSGLTLNLYSGVGQPVVNLGGLGAGADVGGGLLSFGGNGLALTPSTDYWIVASNLTATSNWTYTFSGTGGGTTSRVLWASSSDSGGIWVVSGVAPMMMSVTARSPVQAVPEPVTITLGAAAFGVALKRRRRA